MGPELGRRGCTQGRDGPRKKTSGCWAAASAVTLGRSGGAHIVGRGVVARRRQAVKGPMERERGHECSGEC
jgi:hypothetical protein